MAQSAEDWRSDAKRKYEEKSRGRRFKLTEGDNSVRILPGMKEEGKFGGPPYLEYFAHRNVGPNDRFMTCGKDDRGDGDCWLCDTQIPKLRKSTKQALRARARDMEPVSQFVVQVAYLASDGGWQGPTTWTVPSGGPRAMATQLLGVLMRTRVDYVDLKKGRNLNIERTGTGFRDTRYGAIIPDEDASKVPSNIVAKIKPLSELVQAYDEDELQAAYFGREVDRDDADETEELDGETDDVEPKAKKGKKAKKAEPEPKKSKKGKKKAEPEPPPKKKGKKAKKSEPAPEPLKKSKKGKKAKSDSDDDYTSEEFQELFRDGEDGDAKPAKKGKKGKKAKKS